MAKAPAFQFYPKDYLTDGAVRRMTYEQRGLYVELLSLCWLEDGLPDDTRALAELLGIRHAAFERHWPRMLDRFDLREDGRLSNPRLEAERVKQSAWREKSARGGTASAQARTHHDSTTVEPPLAPKSNTPVSSLQSSSPDSGQVPPLLPSVAEPPAGGPANGAVRVRTRRIRARLPDEWAPSDDAVAYGTSLGFTDGDLERIVDEFCTYWWGEGKAKADWDRTFENRLLQIKHGGKR